MRDSRKISAWQVFFLLMLLMNGAYSLLLPQMVGQRLNHADGSLAILATTVLALVLLWLVKGIAQGFSDKGLTVYLPEVLGKVGGRIAGGLFCAFLAFLTIVFMASFHEMLGAELLPTTPRWLTMTATFVLIGWIVCNGLEDIARFSTLLAPLIILTLILVLLGNVQDMHLVNVLPFGSSGWSERFKTIQLVLQIFLPVCTLLVLYPRVLEQDKVWKLAAVSIIASGIYQALMFFAVIAIFGATEGIRIIWPLVELARMVRIGPFLERLEALFIAIWMSIAFLNGSILTYCTAQSWRDLWPKQSRRRNTVIVFLAIWLGTLAVNDMLRLFLLRGIFGQWVLPGILILLVIMRLAVWHWQHKKGKEGQHAAS